MTADDYVRRVDRALRDLPRNVRRDLIEDLRDHHAELPEDADRVARFGTPENYAAELRAAAGIERRCGFRAYVRTRRPRNLVAAASAAVVLSCAIAGFVWVETYQPLDFGNGILLPGKEVPGAPEYEITFHKGRRFDLHEEVVNYGRFTVRILSFSFGADAPWTARLLMSQPHVRTGGFYAPWMRFRPFDLKPGYSVHLRLLGVQACHKAMRGRTAMTFTALPVRYSFLWKTATAQVPFYEDLKVVFPVGCR